MLNPVLDTLTEQGFKNLFATAFLAVATDDDLTEREKLQAFKTIRMLGRGIHEMPQSIADGLNELDDTRAMLIASMMFDS